MPRQHESNTEGKNVTERVDDRITVIANRGSDSAIPLDNAVRVLHYFPQRLKGNGKPKPPERRHSRDKPRKQSVEYESMKHVCEAVGIQELLRVSGLQMSPIHSANRPHEHSHMRPCLCSWYTAAATTMMMARHGQNFLMLPCSIVNAVSGPLGLNVSRLNGRGQRAKQAGSKSRFKPIVIKRFF
jgi:hypothetical protein